MSLLHEGQVVVPRPTVEVSGARGGTSMSWKSEHLGLCIFASWESCRRSTGVGGSNSCSSGSGHVEGFERPRPPSSIAESPVEPRGDGVRA